ncbi:hypothetical protein D3C80_776450 [compost metagenome]
MLALGRAALGRAGQVGQRIALDVEGRRLGLHLDDRIEVDAGGQVGNGRDAGSVQQAERHVVGAGAGQHGQVDRNAQAVDQVADDQRLDGLRGLLAQTAGHRNRAADGFRRQRHGAQVERAVGHVLAFAEPVEVRPADLFRQIQVADQAAEQAHAEAGHDRLVPQDVDELADAQLGRDQLAALADFTFRHTGAIAGHQQVVRHVEAARLFLEGIAEGDVYLALEAGFRPVLFGVGVHGAHQRVFADFLLGQAEGPRGDVFREAGQVALAILRRGDRDRLRRGRRLALEQQRAELVDAVTLANGLGREVALPETIAEGDDVGDAGAFRDERIGGDGGRFRRGIFFGHRVTSNNYGVRGFSLGTPYPDGRVSGHGNDGNLERLPSGDAVVIEAVFAALEDHFERDVTDRDVLADAVGDVVENPRAFVAFREADPRAQLAIGGKPYLLDDADLRPGRMPLVLDQHRRAGAHALEVDRGVGVVEHFHAEPLPDGVLARDGDLDRALFLVQG